MSTTALYEEALCEAESQAVVILAPKLKLTAGEDLFIGFNPGVADAAVFEIAGIRNPDCVHNNQARVFHFGGTLTLFNRDRRELQKMVMRVIGASPFAEEGLENTNVMQLRVSGNEGCISGITIMDMTPDGENELVEVYTVKVDLDIVFDCGERLEDGY
jgi:hypothetical protein